MIGNNKVLGLIPARGGSKGVPRKNIKDMAGKPLIAWTIEAGVGSKYIDQLVVSTEDSQIASIAEACGADVPFSRPEQLAKDDTRAMDVVEHALGEVPGYDILVYLQPTSPLRTSSDIDRCIEFARSENAVSCISISEVTKKPEWMYRIDSSSHLLEPVLADQIQYANRQEIPQAYASNGAIYVIAVEWFKKSGNFITADTIGWKMSAEKSVDIDTPFDFEVCEWRLNKPI